MSSYTGASQFDDAADLVTNKPAEDWGLILEFCDRVSAANTSASAKEALIAIVKRMNNPNPTTGYNAVKLLEGAFNNGGRCFKVECAQEPLVDEIYRLLQTRSMTPPRVCDAIKETLQNMCLDVQNDSSFSRLLALYHKLRKEGYDYPPSERKVPEPRVTAVSTRAEIEAQEDMDLAKAIEESLKASASQPEPKKEKKKKSKKGKTKDNSSSMYPSNDQPAAAPQAEQRDEALRDDGKRRVKALYTFEVQEEGELGFQIGDVITLLDDNHPDWWKGELRGNVGLFPSNYVEMFASEVLAAASGANNANRNGASYNTGGVSATPAAIPAGAIDGAVVDELLGRLLTAQSSATDAAFNQEIERLYDLVVGSMLPALDQKIAVIDAKDQELGRLNETYCTSMATYDHLSRDAQLAFSAPPGQQGGYPASQQGGYQMPQQY